MANGITGYFSATVGVGVGLYGVTASSGCMVVVVGCSTHLFSVEMSIPHVSIAPSTQSASIAVIVFVFILIT